MAYGFLFATRPGFEPGQREPKSLVLPLHYRVKLVAKNGFRQVTANRESRGYHSVSQNAKSTSARVAPPRSGILREPRAVARPPFEPRGRTVAASGRRSAPRVRPRFSSGRRPPGCSLPEAGRPRDKRSRPMEPGRQAIDPAPEPKSGPASRARPRLYPDANTALKI